MPTRRQYSPLDHLFGTLDQAVRTVFGPPAVTERPNPAAGEQSGPLSEAERREAMRLMRVNHTGEICAQALYQGQALTARLPEVRGQMERAAAEEYDHLDWCERRVQALGGHTSVLNPLFYAASFTIGALAGRAGDRWSLGFVAETEHQVVRHLDSHLERLPAQDTESRAIVGQMKVDEHRHAEHALAAGGAKLPLPVRLAMRMTAKVMTGTTYWI
ncbi:MAG TPA: 2-polyprenyl-3-methyl-6-methoxy-1,4-benzoquinone monooxygenase [Plasticicumulans sp.]|uniref:2-polyprenyl-3-methyl-6-methoxy-1,4-benzoquinone monooxygenase n=1 Tax=Plasticicumulans sp. TaxID=2307179 RepID=UPI002B9DAA47|nr:2-polyprenyl-3-methyl-6-methoxy-1,4-benzoquinone monooxygenase [Plasticicumulans sp.]MBS0600385.1 2-polyprenyl-3-methyl-6-methoxy-1,4-benzoquinone monooxygenase [Pseudomonadota bacterium]HMV39142.1 2-polyprenyl-3-methyl-6-methoxy-1,4-benzoquinone monooxygenase [Plasticicumulans sp.]HMW29780.1 2-polyprenyl-3-methyl-6-methoxy-1,4-benzoquinone monooxygenase [Plasticicumulans sp.]HMZ10630.1 2-polyprenyl-3-methyl-6-methoxy-1,4-benzoquinone monooxygenase [Plasticicumulans sp.]HNB90382.1 2-polypre